jgi:hypothetical protein
MSGHSLVANRVVAPYVERIPIVLAAGLCEPNPEWPVKREPLCFKLCLAVNSYSFSSHSF